MQLREDSLRRPAKAFHVEIMSLPSHSRIGTQTHVVTLDSLKDQDVTVKPILLHPIAAHIMRKCIVSYSYRQNFPYCIKRDSSKTGSTVLDYNELTHSQKSCFTKKNGSRNTANSTEYMYRVTARRMAAGWGMHERHMH